jgi:hypothetical protein
MLAAAARCKRAPTRGRKRLACALHTPSPSNNNTASYQSFLILTSAISISIFLLVFAILFFVIYALLLSLAL